MGMPALTAEASLYRSRAYYRTTAFGSAGRPVFDQVLAAQIGPEMPPERVADFVLSEVCGSSRGGPVKP